MHKKLLKAILIPAYFEIDKDDGIIKMVEYSTVAEPPNP